MILPYITIILLFVTGIHVCYDTNRANYVKVELEFSPNSPERNSISSKSLYYFPNTVK